MRQSLCLHKQRANPRPRLKSDLQVLSWQGNIWVLFVPCVVCVLLFFAQPSMTFLLSELGCFVLAGCSWSLLLVSLGFTCFLFYLHLGGFSNFYKSLFGISPGWKCWRFKIAGKINFLLQTHWTLSVYDQSLKIRTYISAHGLKICILDCAENFVTHKQPWCVHQVSCLVKVVQGWTAFKQQTGHIQTDLTSVCEDACLCTAQVHCFK